ncbi:myosin heavy chain, clone 203 [Tribolium madens]|uniref:myosin heavy chain, clone 203 n=1 Tax=Tribolium madens TaxID=41895 RepID=UPI001CF7548F|nr:myosin heavy chain, clone 203 [Tribolium madens]XP_044262786.1 myosin heavy chain, clone 203 [Tribolium madens]
MKSNQVNVAPAEINKQMLEIKKKIQLSEGQRKAAFEDCEAERKSNIDEIHKLKKEIKELVKELKEKTQSSAALKTTNKKLESIVGPIDEKTTTTIEEMLDLQIIDKSKSLNLLNYKIKKREKLLTDLGQEFQLLKTEKSRKEVVERVDKPAKKATCELQNSIHAVEVQLREANHISARYKDVKKSLLRDAARFESNIKRIEEELELQNDDINDLQQVMNEATRKRSTARGHLLREEKSAMSSAHSREKQTVEGQRLVTRRKQELELLEKRIFQVAKVARVVEEIEEENETPVPPEETLTKAFEVLKKATGATNTEEVLHKFNMQKDTLERLILLRKKSEAEKKQLEKNLDDLNTKLEFFKFAEVKETERKSIKMEQIQNQIEKIQNKSHKIKNLKQVKDKTIQTILLSVQELQICINPVSVPKNQVLETLNCIKCDLKGVLGNLAEEIELEEIEEKWLPSPYSGLVRRTPIPQTGTSPAPPPPPTGSEDEDEVPSRTYLKRQAQLVVDAKSRRKNIRIPAKRN